MRKNTVRSEAPMKPNSDKALRDHLLYVLEGGGAHIKLD